MKKFNMLVVVSTYSTRNEYLLSLRPENGSSNANGIRIGLVAAGFKPNNEVVLIERKALEELLTRCGE